MKLPIFLVILFREAMLSELPRIEIEKSILKDMYMKSKFHSYVRPHVNETFFDEPVEVRVDLHILNLHVCVKKQVYDITMYFRQEWNDSRLAFHNQGKLKYITMHDVLGFWTPDLFFVHETSAHLHSITRPNAFVRIYPDGRTFYSQRLSLKVACPMNLRRFPFDKQKCSLRMESYGYTADELFLQWKTNSSSPFQDSVDISGYDVILSYKDYTIAFGKDRYSTLEMEIHLWRRFADYIYHVFLPLTLFVCASWISFWLNPKSSAMRFMISLTTISFSLLQLQINSQSFVNPGYPTFMDIWVAVCCIFLFAALFENIYVVNMNEMNPATTSNRSSTGAKADLDGKGKIKILLGNLAARKKSTDLIARILFPFMFIFIHIIVFLYVYMDSTNI